MSIRTAKGREISLAREISQALERVQSSSKKAVRLALHKIKNIYNLENNSGCFYPKERRTPESVREENYIKYKLYRF